MNKFTVKRAIENVYHDLGGSYNSEIKTPLDIAKLLKKSAYPIVIKSMDNKLLFTSTINKTKELNKYLDREVNWVEEDEQGSFDEQTSYYYRGYGIIITIK